MIEEMNKTKIDKAIDMLIDGDISINSALEMVKDAEHETQTREKYISGIVNELMSELDVDGIVKYMESIAWRWFWCNKVDSFEIGEFLRGFVTEIVHKIVDEKHDEWYISSGGFDVCGQLSEDNEHIEFEAKFVMSSGYSEVNYYDLKNIEQ